ncbi:hypothetical protein [Lentisalinibacter sediminis]|uniref:hypothetical protein n=1 Tax=Lentisalinibacter sediminis TaxID=2992237 RepID=UPI00386F0F78
MTEWLSVVLNSFVSLFRSRRDLALENLLLRQQLALLKEKGVQPRLSAADRSFWMLVSNLCAGGEARSVSSNLKR